MTKYSENHARIFGPRPVQASGTFRVSHSPKRVNAPAVRGSMEPFLSPIDGSIISTRTQLAAHHREHGTTDSRDYRDGYIERQARKREEQGARELKQSRYADINDAINRHT